MTVRVRDGAWMDAWVDWVLPGPDLRLWNVPLEPAALRDGNRLGVPCSGTASRLTVGGHATFH